jgi:hypothetical protein
MFFRNKKKKIELFFDLEFAKDVAPDPTVNLGMIQADLSLYKNGSLFASYVYPDDSKYFIIQYPEKWVLKFFAEDIVCKNVEDLTYELVGIGSEGKLIIHEEGDIKNV